MVYKTFWLRAVAAFLDSLLLWPLIIMQSNSEGSTLGLLGVMILILQHSYYIIGHAQYGRTLGKRLLGLKVVRTHHHLPLKWKHAIWRQMLWIVISIGYSLVDMKNPSQWIAIPGISLILLDALIAWVHPRHRSLRDFIAETVVIRTSI